MQFRENIPVKKGGLVTREFIATIGGRIKLALLGIDITNNNLHGGGLVIF